jgi:hypothetical protein
LVLQEIVLMLIIPSVAFLAGFCMRGLFSADLLGPDEAEEHTATRSAPYSPPAGSVNRRF